MGFEEYRIALYPKPNSALETGNDLESFRRLVLDVRYAWPALRPDEVESAHLIRPKGAEQEILVSETQEGLFQIFLNLGNRQAGDISISLRFAYANPRSVYKPVCAVTDWLMNRYSLACHIDAELTPEQLTQGIASDIYDSDHLCDILIPSMDYNRKFWQLDARTEEEAILRPGDAVERFMTPLYIQS